MLKVEVALPLLQVPSDCETVELMSLGPLLQSEASTIIVTEYALVAVEGVRKPYVLFSAYQFNWTAVPLACAGTESEVLLAPPFTLVPVVRFDVGPLIEYVTT